jgi:tetratricopeptide (TPR) repeat protein
MERQTDSSNWRATAHFVEGMKLLRKFQTACDWGQLDVAVHKFAEAIKIDPGYKAARFYLGVSKELGGRHDEAALEFEQLRVEAEQPDVDLLYNLGLAYFHQYNPAAYRSAVEHLRKVIELTSGPSPVGATTEESQQNVQRRRTSMRLLAQAILAQVHSHFAIPPKGVSPEEAQEHFREALQIATRSLEEFERSKDQLEQALATDIGWGLHNAIGHAYLYAGRRGGKPEHFEKSISEFNKALQVDPDNYRVLSNLGSAHFFLTERKQGEEAETQLALAEKTFRRVLQLKPNYDFAYTRLVKIALRRGNLEEATRFATLAKQNPSEMTTDYLEQLFRDIEQVRASSGSTE